MKATPLHRPPSRDDGSVVFDPETDSPHASVDGLRLVCQQQPCAAVAGSQRFQLDCSDVCWRIVMLAGCWQDAPRINTRPRRSLECRHVHQSRAGSRSLGHQPLPDHHVLVLRLNSENTLRTSARIIFRLDRLTATANRLGRAKAGGGQQVAAIAELAPGTCLLNVALLHREISEPTDFPNRIAPTPLQERRREGGRSREARLRAKADQPPSTFAV